MNVVFKKNTEMRQLILAFILASGFISIAFAKEIKARVVFENLTTMDLISGEFFIVDLNQKIEVNKAEDFTITLPKNGKYEFDFRAENFNVKISYPSQMTQRTNTIIIRLYGKNETNVDEVFSLSNASNLNLSDEQIEERISQETLNFIIPGIDNSIPEDYVKFKEKYGVGLFKENCAIDPL